MILFMEGIPFTIFQYRTALLVKYIGEEYSEDYKIVAQFLNI